MGACEKENMEWLVLFFLILPLVNLIVEGLEKPVPRRSFEPSPLQQGEGSAGPVQAPSEQG